MKVLFFLALIATSTLATKTKFGSVTHKGAADAISQAQGQLGILASKASSVSDQVSTAYNNVHAVNELVNGSILKTVGGLFGFSLYNKKMGVANAHRASFQGFADALDATNDALYDGKGAASKLAEKAQAASSLIDGLSALF